MATQDVQFKDSDDLLEPVEGKRFKSAVICLAPQVSLESLNVAVKLVSQLLQLLHHCTVQQKSRFYL